jgi:ABC-type branched-subunit amino acid transport system ATPase component
MSVPALEAVALHKRFGALAVAQDINLALPVGARHALIGPNGAGKTTLINLLTGHVTPSSGRIRLGGEDISHMAPNQRVKRGLVRTYQVNSLFAELTPLETITLAVLERTGRSTAWIGSLGRHRGAIEEAAALLAQLGLDGVANRPTHALAYGQQRLLEIALALAGKPKVLLLDEPMAGIPSEESQDILATIAALPADIAILFIEHDMDLVFRFARRITVLVAGAILVEGEPAEILADERVQAIYLGDEHLGPGAPA